MLIYPEEVWDSCRSRSLQLIDLEQQAYNVALILVIPEGQCKAGDLGRTGAGQARGPDRATVQIQNYHLSA